MTKSKFDPSNSTTKKFLAISTSGIPGSKTANNGWARDDQVAEACEVSLDDLHSKLGRLSEADTAMRCRACVWVQAHKLRLSDGTRSTRFTMLINPLYPSETFPADVRYCSCLLKSSSLKESRVFSNAHSPRCLMWEPSISPLDPSRFWPPLTTSTQAGTITRRDVIARAPVKAMEKKSQAGSVVSSEAPSPMVIGKGKRRSRASPQAQGKPELKKRSRRSVAVAVLSVAPEHEKGARTQRIATMTTRTVAPKCSVDDANLSVVKADCADDRFSDSSSVMNADDLAVADYVAACASDGTTDSTADTPTAIRLFTSQVASHTRSAEGQIGNLTNLATNVVQASLKQVDDAKASESKACERAEELSMKLAECQRAETGELDPLEMLSLAMDEFLLDKFLRCRSTPKEVRVFQIFLC